jgi:hypothetical protein
MDLEDLEDEEFIIPIPEDAEEGEEFVFPIVDEDEAAELLASL